MLKCRKLLSQSEDLVRELRSVKEHPRLSGSRVRMSPFHSFRESEFRLGDDGRSGEAVKS